VITDEHTQKAIAAVGAKLTRSRELDKLLADVIDNPDIWMSTPTIQFGGRPPAELVGTEEEFKIFDILRAVDQGLF
jgi:hypothetical protein